MPVLAEKFEDFLVDARFHVVLNTEGLFFLLFDSAFADCVRASHVIFVDGVGLKKALEYSGFTGVKRLHGPDLFHLLIHRNDGRRRMIIGGSAEAHEKLFRKFPHFRSSVNLRFWSGLVDVDDLDELYQLVREFGPDEVYVCLGIRKQEKVARKLSEKFRNISVVGVGAAIDFESGNVVRSSKLMQELGMEWFTRMLREPRMVPRHMRALIGMMVFLITGVFRGPIVFKKYGIGLE